MPGATVGVAEHCELATGTSANITLPPNQPQHSPPASVATVPGVDGGVRGWWAPGRSVTDSCQSRSRQEATQHGNPEGLTSFPHLLRSLACEIPPVVLNMK